MARSSVGVRDLLKAGSLRKGEELTARSRGSQFRARLQEDGRIKVDGIGKVFDSPSLAANEVTGRNTNGWTFWRVHRGSKDLSLAEIRASVSD